MINCYLVSPQISCVNCNKVQCPSNEHCTGCGKSFVFGKPDAWSAASYTSNTTIAGKVKEYYGK